MLNLASVYERQQITNVKNVANNTISLQQVYIAPITSAEGIELSGGVRRTHYHFATHAMNGLVEIRRIAGNGLKILLGSDRWIYCAKKCALDWL